MLLLFSAVAIEPSSNNKKYGSVGVGVLVDVGVFVFVGVVVLVGVTVEVFVGVTVGVDVDVGVGVGSTNLGAKKLYCCVISESDNCLLYKYMLAT